MPKLSQTLESAFKTSLKIGFSTGTFQGFKVHANFLRFFLSFQSSCLLENLQMTSTLTDQFWLSRFENAHLSNKNIRKTC